MLRKFHFLIKKKKNDDNYLNKNYKAIRILKKNHNRLNTIVWSETRLN